MKDNKMSAHIEDLKDTKSPDLQPIPPRSSNVEVAAIEDVQNSPKTQLQRSVVRKLDLTILPMVAVMYLFNSIDRSSLGNAITDTLLQDLHMTTDQYTDVLLLFYIPFCTLEVPANLLTKNYSGRITLPTMMLGWAAVTLAQNAAVNFGGLVACRILMGVFEAGFMAGVVYYLTTFYCRNELALRISIFYGASTVAGAFSGLLAFGVFHIKDDKIPGWKWLFFVEGGVSVLLALLAYWVLPRNIRTCRYFSEEEKLVAEARLLADGVSEVNEKLRVGQALRYLLDWKVPVYISIALCYGLAVATVSNWIPVIVKSLGYSTIKTNLFTVAPYCCGTVILIATCASSDHFRERSTHLAGAMVMTLTGFVILAALDPLDHKAVAYFACFLLTSGTFTPTSIFHSWYNNNMTSESSRAVTTAIMVGAANSGGIWSSLSFRGSHAPRYVPALITGAAAQVVGIILVLSWGAYLRNDNRKRNRAQGVKLRAGDVPTSSVNPSLHDPNWRWTT